MAVKNVVGLFDTTQDAQDAVRDLRDAGITSEDISFVARNEEQVTVVGETDAGSEAAEGAGLGATAGTVVGGLAGLLVGLGALVIPGIGPVIAAGSIATALGTTALGAGIGAASGGLLGALAGAGIPDEDANIYSEGIHRGGALVMARVDEAQVDTVLDVMERHNVIDIDERARSYRDEGWSRFEGDPAYATVATPTADDSTPVDADAYDRSSKVGTAGGAVAGAATGATMGAAGGPVGAVVGGAAGALAGGAIGAAGDTAGQAADEADGTTDYSAVDSDVVPADPGYGTPDSETSLEEDVAVVDTTTGDTTVDRIYDTTMAADTGMTGATAAGDADQTVDGDDYERSSKVGTAGGAVAGAATGATMGAAGGPVGAVVGGAAGAVTGGAIGAAGDAAATEATDDDTPASPAGDVSSTAAGAYGTSGDDVASTPETPAVSAEDTTFSGAAAGSTAADTTFGQAASAGDDMIVEEDITITESFDDPSAASGTGYGSAAADTTAGSFSSTPGVDTSGSTLSSGDSMLGGDADTTATGYGADDSTLNPDVDTSASLTPGGDADRTVDGDDYERSSKVGTAGGAVAGAATGATMGAAGGPVGAVVGGAAGAVAGGAIGAAGDAAATEATDDDTPTSPAGDVSSTAGEAGTADVDAPALNWPEDADAPADEAAAVDADPDAKPSITERLTNAAERLFGTDMDKDGDVGEDEQRNP